MGSPAFQEVTLSSRDGGLFSVADNQPFHRIMELDDSIYFQCTAENCPAIMLVQRKSSSKGLLISKHNEKSHQSRYSVIRLFSIWVWWSIQSALRLASTVTGLPLPRQFQGTSFEEIPQPQQRVRRDGWLSWGAATVLWAFRCILFFVCPTWALILGRLIPWGSSPPASSSNSKAEQFRDDSETIVLIGLF
uniref:IGv domain-containing protein n=1 Tax=Steinernema glaseri TaxID=37863 RepID=A0A1I7XX42_9BILA